MLKLSERSAVECKTLSQYRWRGTEVWRECGVGLNAILGRGLNINELPRKQCRATNMSDRASKVLNGCAYLGVLSLLLDACANKYNFRHREASIARDRDG